MKFVPNGPNNNMPALVQITDWHWTGDKQLHEQMMNQLNDAHMRHSFSIGEC